LQQQATGAVAFAAVHQRLHSKDEPWPYYCLVFDNGEIFLSRRQPVLYAADASLISTREIPPGSVVRVRYDELNGIRQMTAVQIIRMAEDQSPFDPETDDEAG
jgi:hypothetical protein